MIEGEIMRHFEYLLEMGSKAVQFPLAVHYHEFLRVESLDKPHQSQLLFLLVQLNVV